MNWLRHSHHNLRDWTQTVHRSTWGHVRSQDIKHPRSHLANVATGTRGGYAHGVDPAFDSDHFAVWGRQYAQDVPLIQARVAIYQPDLLLVELGFNDVGWWVD